MAKQLTRNDVKEIVTQVIQENNIVLMKEFRNIYTILAQHDNRFNELDNKIVSIKNDVARFEDKVMGVIKDMRDEIAVLTGYKDDIEDYGVRIDKLEEKLFPAKN